MHKGLLPFLLCLTVGFTVSCTPPPEAFTAVELNTSTGGQKAVRLGKQRSANENQPEILGADILPGRGMNIYQVRAYIPGLGVTDLIAAPSMAAAGELLTDGNESFKVGGAILLPYANRIRGELLPDGQYLETTILGQTVRLPANWKGNEPGAEPHAMHGLILDGAMDSVHYEADSNGARVIGKLSAGGFNGHWLSKADIRFESELTGSFFGFRVTVENVGDDDLPMGIGWHPYFVFPSGKREQAKLHIPAMQRALVNNYDDVFPTGELEALAGTHYDVSVSGGLALGDLFLDDCFVDLQKAGDGRVVAEIVDPEARYGLRVIGLSPEISAFQVYAPVDQAFVALEPQFNWADPYSPIWGGKDTGMVVLKPGDSVEYAVRLEVFVP